VIPDYQLWLGDCLEEMSRIEDGSVDMILADLPYQVTNCSWDKMIPFEPLWLQYKRVIKKRGAVVLFGSQPFTSALVMSNPEWFKWDIVWRKIRVTGHLDAKRKPLREHETILLFCNGMPTYNPQMTSGKKHIRGPFGNHKKGTSTVYGKFLDNPSRQNTSDEYYPKSTIEFLAEMQPIHPTQKPVALLSYLILTYTNPGELVLDNCAGSGSTLEAATRTGRRSIGIEKDLNYYQIATQRLERVVAELEREQATPKQLELGA
jgi:DNA modification methylase